MKLLRCWSLYLALLLAAPVAAFDHSHSDWAQVLERHLIWNEARTLTLVNYDALQSNPTKLNNYLEGLSAVTRPKFERWGRDRQLAFLINAYNAYTLKLIIDHYPVESIRDIGAFWQSPWKKRFFTLLGERRHLDELEHQMIRERGVYNEPRIHFAVNCASLGCPTLRPEPFVADKLERQLHDSTRLFLRDRSRNRYRDGELSVSSIFKWYREDFQRGWNGVSSLDEFFARYADALGLAQSQRDALNEGEMEYRFLDYDWSLNDVRP